MFETLQSNPHHREKESVWINAYSDGDRGNKQKERERERERERYTRCALNLFSRSHSFAFTLTLTHISPVRSLMLLDRRHEITNTTHIHTY